MRIFLNLKFILNEKGFRDKIKKGIFKIFLILLRKKLNPGFET